jgi:hypothetical protein
VTELPMSSRGRGDGSPAGTTVGARPSRAAAIRAARAKRDTPAVTSLIAPVPPLPEDLADLFVGWTPQKVDVDRWMEVRDAVVLAVTACRPPSKSVLRNQRSLITAFALWLRDRPERKFSGPLDPQEFLVEGIVDAYLVGPLGDAPDASRASVRSVLRKAIRNLDARPGPESIAHQPVQPPYSPAECARFVALARNQPTDAARRSLSAVIALGLGAGLGPEDQRPIAPCHVREVDLGAEVTGLAVDVPGQRARTVVVRAEYENLLREALELHQKARRGARTPLSGDKPERKNAANKTASRAVTATGQGIDLSTARLRTTWLVACMPAAVPLGALLHASGLRSPRTLNDLLQYCPAPNPVEVAAALRVAAHSNRGESAHQVSP